MTDTMKILHIAYSFGAGGAERFIIDLANYQAEQQDTEVYILHILKQDSKTNGKVSTKTFKDFIDPKVKIVYGNQSKGFGLSPIKKIYSVINEIKPDVVHDHCNPMLIAVPSILLPATKYISTFHSVVNRRLRNWVTRTISRYLFATDRITPVTISPQCQKSYLDVIGNDKSKCILNGRSLSKTTKELSAIRTLIESCKVYNDDKIFIHVARAHPVKNQKLLFEAFSELESEDCHVQLIVIGDKYDSFDLTKYASKRIHFMGLRTNVSDFLACGDFFILSSLVEGLPISLLEAYSFGLIPISTPAGGIVDVIKDGKTGFISKDFTVENFIVTIKRAIGNYISSESIKEYYNKNYSIELCGDLYMDLYRNLIVAKPSSTIRQK